MKYLKKIAFFLLLITISLSVYTDATYAQVQCSVVDQYNYTECCGTSASLTINGNACRNYVPSQTPSQTTQLQCGSFDTITDSNYNNCCLYSTANTNACNDYRTYKTLSCTTIDNDYEYNSLCCKHTDNIQACITYAYGPNAQQNGTGAIGSGVPPNTNPQNNTSGVTPGFLVNPQASSSELSSCNKIRFNSILDILIWLKCIIGAAIIPLIFSLAMIYFLWGMVKFIRSSDDKGKREESKKFILWGIIGLTVMVSLWGIVNIVNTTFGFGNTVPELDTDYLKK